MHNILKFRIDHQDALLRVVTEFKEANPNFVAAKENQDVLQRLDDAYGALAKRNSAVEKEMAERATDFALKTQKDQTQKHQGPKL